MLLDGNDHIQYGIGSERKGSASLSIEADMLRNGTDRLRYGTDLEHTARRRLVLELTWFWVEGTVSSMEMVRGEKGFDFAQY